MEKEVNTKYLESKGFMEEKGPYSFVRGTLADVRALPCTHCTDGYECMLAFSYGGRV